MAYIGCHEFGTSSARKGRLGTWREVLEVAAAAWPAEVTELGFLALPMGCLV